MRLSAASSAPPAIDLAVNAPEQRLQPVEIEWLAQVVHRTVFDRLDGGVDAGMAGHQDDLAVGIGGTDAPEHFKAVDIGHAQVDKRDRDAFGLQLLQRLVAASSRRDFEPDVSSEFFDQPQNARLIVNDEEDRL